MSYHPSDIEAEEQLKTTQDLIYHCGRDLELNRRASYVSDGAGGRVRQGSDVLQSPKRLFFQQIRSNDVYYVNQQGESVLSTYVLLGMPDDDIQEGDTFSVDGLSFEVIWIHPDIRYEKRAEVRSYGNSE